MTNKIKGISKECECAYICIHCYNIHTTSEYFLQVVNHKD